MITITNVIIMREHSKYCSNCITVTSGVQSYFTSGRESDYPIICSKSWMSQKFAVFRAFVGKLVALQKQLHRMYQDDNFLGDQLLTNVGQPEIQTMLKGLMSQKSQDAIHRISKSLSDRSRKAGVTITSLRVEVQDKGDDELMYSLGRLFGGNSKRKVISYRGKTWIGAKTRGYKPRLFFLNACGEGTFRVWKR